jgi:predicted dithiol-disulfide oxidoreductase (DUF899 family)
MPVTFPGESPEYRAARDRLLQQEVELRRMTESVARARRALPPGGLVPPGYVFEGRGPGGASRRQELADLFAPGQSTLAIYSYMFGPERESPCPMCTGILDGLDAVAEHIGQRLTLCVVAESPLPRLLAFAEQRGWRRLRLLSAAGSTYNRDYHGKTAKGNDSSMLNVFHRSGDEVRHFWGTEMFYYGADPGQDDRAVDIISPIFNMFDLTPEGRGDFYTKVRYS